MTRPDDQLVERVLTTRYRTLLRVYPEKYRAERGDEMLGTLLDAARPGQRWPNRSDTASLILGGLRARAGAPPTSAGAVLTDALYLAVFAWVVAAVVTTSGYFGSLQTEGGWAGTRVFVSFALPFGLGVVTLLALARRRYAVAVGALSAGMLLGWSVQPLGLSHIGVDPSAPVLLTLVALAWRRHRPTFRWPVALAVVPLAMPYGHLDVLQGSHILFGSELGRWTFVLLPVLVAAVWAVVEPRLIVAVAGCSVLVYLDSLWDAVAMRDHHRLYVRPAEVAAVGLAAAVGWLVVRRQTRM